jgi:hypothetical protein
MDIARLTVGQNVFIHTGPVWHYKGQVVSVTPSGVEVRVPANSFELCKLTTGAEVKLPGNVVRFDVDGGCECGTRECGPWVIDDETPFAEREAQIERIRREARTSKQLYIIRFFGTNAPKCTLSPEQVEHRKKIYEQAAAKMCSPQNI